jgi:hypothetical protein
MLKRVIWQRIKIYGDHEILHLAKKPVSALLKLTITEPSYGQPQWRTAESSKMLRPIEPRMEIGYLTVE